MYQPFILPDPQHHARSLAAQWFKLGVFALLASGVFSLLLVLSRTPGVQNYIPWLDFFHTALVVHVVLSVVIWFIAFAGVIWVSQARIENPLWDRIIFITTALGTALICLSPFTGDGNPIMNNYVPILEQPVFLIGLGLFGLGFVWLIIRMLIISSPFGNNRYTQNTSSPLHLAIYLSIITAAVSMLALLLSRMGIDDAYSGQAFYELLFWGGGHSLQFTHTFLLIVAWMVLASATGIDLKASPWTASLLLLLMFAPVLLVPYLYTQADVTSAEHRRLFTDLMRYGGLTSIPLGALVAIQALISRPVKQAAQRPLRNALLASVILFAAGGIIGFLIQGVNVVIPAHYHGSIVGVTLAFMGLAYYFMPRLGFHRPESRMAAWQPFIYGGGQLMHILGLAWSGGYGVQRKTAGAAQGLDRLPEVLGMGMMGLGGLIAIIGGAMFVIIALKSMYGSRA